MRQQLKKILPESWLHYEFNNRQMQWVLILGSIMLSMLVLFASISTQTPLDLFLWGGSIIFIAVFCSPSLSSVQNACGNGLDGLSDRGWMVVHLLSNAVFYYVVFLLLILLVRLVQKAEPDKAMVKEKMA